MHRLCRNRGHGTGPAHYFTTERSTAIRRRDHGWCEVGLEQTRSRTTVLSGAQFESEAATRFRCLDCRGQILGQGSCCTHRSRRGTSAGNDGRRSFDEGSSVQVSNSSVECLLRWRPRHSVASGGAMKPSPASSGAPTAGLQAGSLDDVATRVRISRHRGHPFHGIADSVSQPRRTPFHADRGQRFSVMADSGSARG